MKHVLIVLACAGLLSACAAPFTAQENAQEQLACARVGIAPGSGAFRQCVGDLDLTQQEERSID